MPRYDKYEPHAGGFRALLANAIAAADGFTAYAVGLDVDGHVVLGAGQSGVVGVLVAHGAKNAGDAVDVMTAGEIVEFTADGTEAGAAAAAGTAFFGDTVAGAISTTNTGKSLGFTSEGSRLIVRVGA